MTPEEAIKIAIHCLGVQAEQEVCEECDIYGNCHTDCKDAAVVAIKALEEIQQYREMERKLEEAYGKCDGLLEVVVDNLYLHKGRDIGKPKKATLLTDDSVDMWEAYKQIGTVEECREAVEKQKAKKCVIDSFPDHMHYKCPSCGKIHLSRYKHGCPSLGRIPRFCEYCGQAIDENLEEKEDE